jgi:hypothetical protein
MDARYAALWSRSDGPAWEARHELTEAEYQTTSDTMGARGYTLRNLSGYAVRGEARYAAIWEQSDGPERQARHGLTPAQYQAAFDQFAAQGFRLVQVSGYRVNLDVLFAAIWERRSGAAWQARHALTAAEYRHALADLTAQGYRLAWMNAYSQGGRARYAAIWEQAPGPAWQSMHGLDPARYQQNIDQLAAQGFALAQVCGYGEGFD